MKRLVKGILLTATLPLLYIIAPIVLWLYDEESDITFSDFVDDMKGAWK